MLDECRNLLSNAAAQCLAEALPIQEEILTQLFWYLLPVLLLLFAVILDKDGNGLGSRWIFNRLVVAATIKSNDALEQAGHSRIGNIVLCLCGAIEDQVIVPKTEWHLMYRSIRGSYRHGTAGRIDSELSERTRKAKIIFPDGLKNEIKEDELREIQQVTISSGLEQVKVKQKNLQQYRSTSSLFLALFIGIFPAETKDKYIVRCTLTAILLFSLFCAERYHQNARVEPANYVDGITLLDIVTSDSKLSNIFHEIWPLSVCGITFIDESDTPSITIGQSTSSQQQSLTEETTRQRTTQNNTSNKEEQDNQEEQNNNDIKNIKWTPTKWFMLSSTKTGDRVYSVHIPLLYGTDDWRKLFMIPFSLVRIFLSLSDHHAPVTAFIAALLSFPVWYHIAVPLFYQYPFYTPSAVVGLGIIINILSSSEAIEESTAFPLLVFFYIIIVNTLPFQLLYKICSY